MENDSWGGGWRGSYGPIEGAPHFEVRMSSTGCQYTHTHTPEWRTITTEDEDKRKRRLKGNILAHAVLIRHGFSSRPTPFVAADTYRRPPNENVDALLRSYTVPYTSALVSTHES